ncbi:pantetheine-phosphate adenylyltransferase [Candidatus Entotheonella palauensis]|nr:pantetheine-phosphate adenylyltransferase [Candidatus Entotheonella palauensis]
MTTAIFPGTFDPATNGHLDLIRRSARIFDKVVVAIFDNPSKRQMFSLEERLSLLQQITEGLGNVDIVSFQRQLTVALARTYQASVIVKGVRSVADFEYETQMASMNRYMDDDIETVYLTSRVEYSFVASSLVKEVASLGADVSELVPPVVFEALHKKLQSTNA